jgi:hypothetical protein
MVDLALLEKRLQSDDAYRKTFIKDPVAQLKKLGLTLSDEQAQFLRDSIAGRVKTTPARPRTGIIAVLIGL